MKSQGVRDDEAKQPPEVKLVSTVAAAAAKVINIDDLAKANKPSDSSDTPISPGDQSTSTGHPEEKPKDEPTTDSSSTPPRDESTSIKGPESLKEQGPVIEEVAEADRVRAELFDENPDQSVEAV